MKAANAPIAVVRLPSYATHLRSSICVVAWSVVNPLRSYLDAVDTSAFEKAESGGSIGQFDAPLLPLVAPWIMSGPVLALVRLSSDEQFAVFVASMVMSFTLWASAAWFYYRRVTKYRHTRPVSREH